MDWSQVKHFSQDEFDDPEFPGSGEHMADLTVIGLDLLREKSGWVIVTHNRFGVRGCVCMTSQGHSKNSRHYVSHPEGCSAVDFHFVTSADPRTQAMVVIRSGFAGIGIYYDWKWGGKPLPVGFHVDRRHRPQVWRRENGDYFYLLK